VTQGYGLTETSPFASYNGFLQHRPGTIGTPIENVEMKVVDVTTGADVAVGELGELVIKGPNVMLGYWNKPVETAQVLKNGWFRSGDIGRMDADGYFQIADRLKDMIDVGGMNVYPVQVENVLYEQGEVAEAAVFGIPDELMGERVCAHVVLKPGSAATAEQLLGFCRERLTDFKVPRVLELVGELPKNPAGKVLKRVLRDKAAPERRTPASEFTAAYFGAPVEGRRQVLIGLLTAELAAKLDLPASAIGPEEPLTDLGLESLMAVDLGTRLRALLGVDFSVLVMVNGGTLNSLTNALAKTLDEAHPTGTP
jgi:long-chain acyl-CoA synthetase